MAVDNNVQLELQSNSTKAVNSIQLLISKLDNLSKSLNKVTSLFDKTSNEIKDSGDKIESSGNKADKSTKKFEKLGKSMKSSFDINNMKNFFNILKSGIRVVSEFAQESVDFIETSNLFNVAMGEYSEQATDFVETLSQAFGLAREEMMRFQATFKNILGSLEGISDKAAYNLSESLVKMAIDYSSLFNVSVSRAMTSIQAAITGRVRPIRSVSGFDVTEITIFQKSQELGIDKSMRQLSQVEKRLLRILTLQDQMLRSNAMNDFAETIENPANQLKILSEQMKELKRAIGDTFIGVLSDALPYINAFVMTLVEVFDALAAFFGYELPEARDGVDDITNAFGELGEEVDNVNKKLFSFDKFNVLDTSTTDDETDYGEVSPEILNALDEYNSKLDGVKMRAREIQEIFMKGLGFEKLEDGTYVFNKLFSGFDELDRKSKGLIVTLTTIGVLLTGIAIKASIAVLSLVGWPILLAAAITTALTAIVVYWDDIKKFFKEVFKEIVKFGKASIYAFKNFFTDVFNGIIKLINITIAVSVGGINLIVKSINALISVLNKIPLINIQGVGEIKAPKIPMFADGGMVGTGQMFVARESGPELVGNIGGQTAVANNDQIVQAVSQGVASAVASVLGSRDQNISVSIDGKSINDSAFVRAIFPAIKVENKRRNNALARG